MLSTNEEDHYETLEVSETASKEEIKTQYHQLARKLHSDTNVHADEERLKKINIAYEILGNAPLRKQYDQERASNRAKAEADRRAEQVREARKQRERSAKTAGAFGTGLRGQDNSRARPQQPKSTPPNSTTTPKPRPKAHSQPPPSRSTSPKITSQAPTTTNTRASPGRESILPSGVDVFRGVCTCIGVALLVAAPWVIMEATGLAKNTNALGEGNLLAALLMIVCGLWAIASIGIVICIVGYLVFSGLGLLAGIFK
jgi:DnaJ-domain-containing protein 1